MKNITSTFIFSGILVTMLFSCGKTTNVEGHVYSRYGTPVSNVRVDINLYKGSSYPDHSVASTRTDKDGHYKLSFKYRNNRSYSADCEGDSGTYASWGLTRGQTQTADLHLK